MIDYFTNDYMGREGFTFTIWLSVLHCNNHAVTYSWYTCNAYSE